jgi:hypothetical protein
MTQTGVTLQLDQKRCMQQCMAVGVLFDAYCNCPLAFHEACITNESRWIQMSSRCDVTGGICRGNYPGGLFFKLVNHYKLSRIRQECSSAATKPRNIIGWMQIYVIFVCMEWTFGYTSNFYLKTENQVPGFWPLSRHVKLAGMVEHRPKIVLIYAHIMTISIFQSFGTPAIHRFMVFFWYRYALICSGPWIGDLYNCTEEIII